MVVVVVVVGGRWREIGACERAGRQEGIMTGPIAKDKEVDVFPFSTRPVPLILPPFQHTNHTCALSAPSPPDVGGLELLIA